MDVIFLKLFNMSIAASWIIIAAIVLRVLFKKAPIWLTCLLWAIAAIRLICPFSFESVLSLIPSAEVFSKKVITSNTFYVDTGITVFDNSVNNYMENHYYKGVTAPAVHGNSMMNTLGIIWIFGLLLLLAYCIISYLKLRNKVQESMPLRDNILLCDAVKSPFILGIISPKIYLSSSTNEEQMYYILAHEQAHLKCKDHWWKPLGYLLLAIYWFNPLMWVAYILLCRDIELACDEKVIKDMSMDRKKAYSNALIDCSMQRRMIIACPLAFGEVGVKERVKTVMNYKKPTFWIIVVAVVACIVVAVCFLTNPRSDTFDIKIVIPSGSESGVYYSNEEISLNKSRLTLSLGQGIGDTELSLKPVDVNDENVYVHPVYATPGMPVKMDAEKGTWFKIGINTNNLTDEDIVVYVTVKGVEVRIADSASTPQNAKLQDFNPVGTYYDDMGSGLIITLNPDESYTVEYGIYKLAYMENATGIYNKDNATFSFEGIDYNNKPLAADLLFDGDHYVVTLTKSSYKDCPIGTSFRFYPDNKNSSKVSNETANETIDYSAYNTLIAQARDVLVSGEWSGEEPFSNVFYSNWDYETLGYLIMDIDGNGVDELIFGANGDVWNGIIYDLYTIMDGEVVHVLDGWERNRYYLCENGYIANEGSSSAFESSYDYSKYNGVGLSLMESVLHNSNYNEENPWFYSTEIDPVIEDAKSISSDEAENIINKYVYKHLEYIPFIK